MPKAVHSSKNKLFGFKQGETVETEIISLYKYPQYILKEYQENSIHDFWQKKTQLISIHWNKFKQIWDYHLRP